MELINHLKPRKMPSEKSFLSNPKYGYDFVVATTQASINSGLKEYLANSDQPTTYLCFLVDDEGLPSKYIDLDDLKKLTGGVNPFEIPEDTPYDDPRISKLTEARFIVGLKLKMGLPPGILPKDLPPIVELGSSASNVTFNLFCSEFQIVENTPPGGFVKKGKWQVFNQPQVINQNNKLWSFQTNVNLIYKDLEKDLNTPYFKQFPKQRKALLARIQNLESGAFSLQQLLFDLDNAGLSSVPSIHGIENGSNANLVLTKYFLTYYFKQVKAHGDPVISVHAVTNSADPSTLKLTGLEREVSPFVDGNGIVIKYPTKEQSAVKTLDFLCAVNNNHLPGAATFDWNWVDPDQLNEESGVIAINRNTIANYFKHQLLPVVKQSCVKPWTKTVAKNIVGSLWYYASFTPGQTPTSIVIPTSGPDVLKFSYRNEARSHDKMAATYGELNIVDTYDCTVSFSGKKITIVQHSVVNVYAQWAATGDSSNVVDIKITDDYELSIGQSGDIQVKLVNTNKEDKSSTGRVDCWRNFWTGVDDLLARIAKKVQVTESPRINDIPATDLQNFIFPGGKVFTYKDVIFSDNQDLVAKITYLKPS